MTVIVLHVYNTCDSTTNVEYIVTVGKIEGKKRLRQTEKMRLDDMDREHQHSL